MAATASTTDNDNGRDRVDGAGVESDPYEFGRVTVHNDDGTKTLRPMDDGDRFSIYVDMLVNHVQLHAEAHRAIAAFRRKLARSQQDVTVLDVIAFKSALRLQNAARAIWSEGAASELEIDGLDTADCVLSCAVQPSTYMVSFFGKRITTRFLTGAELKKHHPVAWDAWQALQELADAFHFEGAVMNSASLSPSTAIILADAPQCTAVDQHAIQQLIHDRPALRGTFDAVELHWAKSIVASTPPAAVSGVAADESGTTDVTQDLKQVLDDLRRQLALRVLNQTYGGVFTVNPPAIKKRRVSLLC